MQGIIISGSNNVFEVECDDGVIRQCSLKGKKLKEAGNYYNPLCPGDYVEIEKDTHSEGEGQILSLVERKNAFVRYNVKGRLPQLLVANVDLLLCVTTPDEPPFRPRFIDRALAQAEQAGIEPIIICNKCDLDEIHNEEIKKRLSSWEELGYTVLGVSAKTHEGFEQLAALMEGKLCAFVGQSGVGKSSIINSLDSSFVLRVGGLSEKYGRGTHTTTKGVLLHLEINEALTGGRHGVKTTVIDTPGVRRFVLNDIEADDLALYFREMKDHVGQCSFGMSCSHTHEKGCKILAGLENGSISQERYESWERIAHEIKTGSWAD